VAGFTFWPLVILAMAPLDRLGGVGVDSGQTSRVWGRPPTPKPPG
jgi:hypothetical protein